MLGALISLWIRVALNLLEKARLGEAMWFGSIIHQLFDRDAWHLSIAKCLSQAFVGPAFLILVTKSIA